MTRTTWSAFHLLALQHVRSRNEMGEGRRYFNAPRD